MRRGLRDVKLARVRSLSSGSQDISSRGKHYLSLVKFALSLEIQRFLRNLCSSPFEYPHINRPGSGFRQLYFHHAPSLVYICSNLNAKFSGWPTGRPIHQIVLLVNRSTIPQLTEVPSRMLGSL